MKKKGWSTLLPVTLLLAGLCVFLVNRLLVLQPIADSVEMYREQFLRCDEELKKTEVNLHIVTDRNARMQVEIEALRPMVLGYEALIDSLSEELVQITSQFEELQAHHEKQGQQLIFLSENNTNQVAEIRRLKQEIEGYFVEKCVLESQIDYLVSGGDPSADSDVDAEQPAAFEPRAAGVVAKSYLGFGGLLVLFFILYIARLKWLRQNDARGYLRAVFGK